MEELKVTFEKAPEGGLLTILTGEAPTPLKLREKQPLSLEGSIRSIIDFAEKRKNIITPDKAHLIIDMNKGVAVLVIDDREEIKTTVKGKLVRNKAFELFGVNDVNKLFVAKELRKLVQLNQHLFEKRNEAGDLLGKLEKFAVAIDSEFTDINDYRSEVVYNKTAKIKHQLPASIDLKLAVFADGPKEVIRILLEIVPDGQSIKIALVSPDLAEIEGNSVDIIMNELKEHAVLSLIPIVYV